MKHDKNFERLGYTIYHNALSDKITGEMQNHVKFLSNLYPKTRPEAFHHDMLVGDPFIHHILNQDCITEISKHYLGPDFALFGAHYIAKKPYNGRPVGWHQDGSYWPLDPMKVISLWVAGTSSNKNNGCMKVIPGSQKKKILHPSKMMKLNPEKYVLDLGIDKKDINTKGAKNINLNPGDISVHNPNIIHGSNPNYSSDWRIGLTLRIIPTSTLVIRDNWKCIHLSGKKGDNKYIRKPKFNSQLHMKFDGWKEFK